MLHACYNSKVWESTSQNSAAVWSKRNPPHTHTETRSAKGGEKVHRQQLGNNNLSFSGCILKWFLSNLYPKNFQKCNESQNIKKCRCSLPSLFFQILWKTIRIASGRVKALVGRQSGSNSLWRSSLLRKYSVPYPSPPLERERNWSQNF